MKNSSLCNFKTFKMNQIHINFSWKLFSAFISFVLFASSVYGQNIYFGEPVQVVGSFNGYDVIPYNSDYRTTTFRRVSTSSLFPTDGRGQWATTINVQNSGGNVTPVNMTGGGGNGFLFISGPGSNRFQNKWVFGGIGQGTLNEINDITCYNCGEDMGLNMSVSGYYTFVLNDCGYTGFNAKFYTGYTSASPVTVSRSSQTSSGGNAVISINTSAAPSIGENIYVRYKVGTNDFSASTSVVQASGSGTSWTATIPILSCDPVYYYVYSSTRTLAQIAADSEGNRSLAVLRYDDNGGNNYEILFGVDQPSNQTVCNNAATSTVTFSGAVGGTIFNWTNNNPSIGLPASGTGDIPSFIATNVSNVPVVATITVTPSLTPSGSNPPTGWSFSKPFKVTENSGSNLTDYQLRLVVNTQELITAGSLKADGSDIRFGYNNGSTLLNYWIESGVNTASTVVWVKLDNIPASSDKTIFMYFGNPLASSASAIEGTFVGPHSATDSVASGGAGGATLSQRGFRFAPNEDILATHFGKREPNGSTRYITLFDFNTQAILSQFQVSGPAGQYNYGALPTPLWLTQNTQYTLQLYQGSSDGYYFGTSSQIGQHLTYLDMRYCNSCTQNTFPNNVLNNYHYGYPDLWYFTKNNISPAPTYEAFDECSGPSKTFSITVNPTPVVNLSGEGVYCGGSTVDLNATPGFVQYSWDRWAYGALPQTTPTVSISKSGNYTVVVTDANNCTGANVATVEIGDYVFNGAINGGDLSKPNRLFKPGGALPSCNLPLTCPGNSGAAGPFHYDQYNITNTDNINSVCAVVSLFPKCTSFLNTSVYLGTFDPLNNCLNYLGDSKQSFYGGAWVYDVIIPAGATIVVVVDNFTSGSFCNDYSLVVDVPRSAPGITVDQGSSVCAGSDITLTASPANTYLWSPGGSTSQSITASPVNNTSYQVLLGYGNNGCTATASQNINITPLPCGWSAEPNGVNCTNGSSFTYNQTSQIFTGTSTNCYYPNPFTSDQMAFAQYELCGNGTITAEVTSITGTALGWAGVIMRENNTAGAKKAQLMTNRSDLSRREFRTTTNGQAYPHQFPSQNRYWLRITRAGNQFVMHISPNGTTWYPAGAQNIIMTNCIEIGLVVTNYNPNSTVTATFANVSVTGGVTRPIIADTGNIFDEPLIADFNLLPNPSTGTVELDFSAYSNKNVHLEIYSLQGKMLHTIRYDEVNDKENLDLSNLNSGMYIIRVRSEGLPDVTKRLVLNTH